MNYIKRLEMELAIERSKNIGLKAGIGDLLSYLMSSKFHGDTTIQVNDVMSMMLSIDFVMPKDSQQTLQTKPKRCT